MVFAYKKFIRQSIHGKFFFNVFINKMTDIFIKGFRFPGFMRMIPVVKNPVHVNMNSGLGQFPFLCCSDMKGCCKACHIFILQHPPFSTLNSVFYLTGSGSADSRPHKEEASVKCQLALRYSDRKVNPEWNKILPD